ncbi:hypothetical protein SAMN05216259_10821 [Actinacidiphila guanduensis]|uniref:Uncharacterized protein n=1 Tax=Actinacidiphila guanduensis TaxID=310781 RepID=A0A1H0HF23_9ACTN|nr:hypothetical protein SAMN05216259_10821 [Actinacidiphila guanduensis]
MRTCSGSALRHRSPPPAASSTLRTTRTSQGGRVVSQDWVKSTGTAPSSAGAIDRTEVTIRFDPRHPRTAPNLRGYGLVFGPAGPTIESASSTVRLRTKVTCGAGSPAALAMVFKLVESAQERWRAITGAHLVALVRSGTRFESGILVEREDLVTRASGFGCGALGCHDPSVCTMLRDAVRCRSCRDDSKPSRSYIGTAVRPEWTVTRADPRDVACSEAASTSAEPIPRPRWSGMTKTLWMSADSRLVAPGLGTRGTSATQAMPTISGRRSRATNARCECRFAVHHRASSAANASRDRCPGSSLRVSSHKSRAKPATSSAFAWLMITSRVYRARCRR